MDRTITVTIADGESLSEAAISGGHRLVGIRTPETLTGSVLTFQALVGGGFADLYSDAGDEITVIVAAPGSLIGIDAQRNELETIKWATHLKVRAGMADDPSAQTGPQEIILLLEEL